MKRKKWSELEEQTLLSKYSDLLNSGTLAKLKTREKKFKPIADHVNSLHHLHDPITFPFKWSWRDVSIKVQNMRHQYLGVKQKIRISSSNEFNWGDGEIHWENFLKYKEVFGDIELSSDVGGKDKESNNNTINGGQMKKFGEEGVADILGYEIDSEEIDDEDEVDEEEEEEEGEGCDLVVSDEGEEGAKEGNQELNKGFKRKSLRMMGAKVLELKDVICRREEKRRDREWSTDDVMMEKEMERKEWGLRIDRRLKEREENIYKKEMEMEELRMLWAKREFEKRRRLEREFDEERKRRMKLEEKWEEEEMEWRERMFEMQMEHEKQMMQIHADACQNQLQILGIMARLVCQFFGSTNDGLGGGLGTIPPQVLQNLQHPGSLGDNGKPDATSPSEFL